MQSPYCGSMEAVNDRIREAVRIELARRASNQAELAEKVGVSKQYISDVMRARAGKVPAVWQRILDELDLDLVVRPRAASTSASPGILEEESR